jgi:hypothetical protein
MRTSNLSNGRHRVFRPPGHPSAARSADLISLALSSRINRSIHKFRPLRQPLTPGQAARTNSIEAACGVNEALRPSQAQSEIVAGRNPQFRQPIRHHRQPPHSGVKLGIRNGENRQSIDETAASKLHSQGYPELCEPVRSAALLIAASFGSWWEQLTGRRFI